MVIIHIIAICAKKRYSITSNAASAISGNWHWYAHYELNTDCTRQEKHENEKCYYTNTPEQ